MKRFGAAAPLLGPRHGRVVRDMYLAQVETPAESCGLWDLYRIEKALPGASPLPPPSQTACPSAR